MNLDYFIHEDVMDYVGQTAFDRDRRAGVFDPMPAGEKESEGKEEDEAENRKANKEEVRNLGQTELDQFKRDNGISTLDQTKLEKQGVNQIEAEGMPNLERSNLQDQKLEKQKKTNHKRDLFKID